MSGRYEGLIEELADPQDYLRPSSMGVETDRDFLAREAKHEQELDEMIRMGWGNVDQARIPADWRTRTGPDSEARLLSIRQGVEKANETKRERQIPGFAACKNVPRGRRRHYVHRLPGEREQTGYASQG